MRRTPLQRASPAGLTCLVHWKAHTRPCSGQGGHNRTMLNGQTEGQITNLKLICLQIPWSGPVVMVSE